jgi:hypothetical protein
VNIPASGVDAHPAMSVSGGVPVIDVEQVCQGIANQAQVTLNERESAKKYCLDTEQEVRDKLAKVWTSFNAADRNHCFKETNMGGESSYTELLTCLEMAAEVQKLHEEGDIARRSQSIGQR